MGEQTWIDVSTGMHSGAFIGADVHVGEFLVIFLTIQPLLDALCGHATP